MTKNSVQRDRAETRFAAIQARQDNQARTKLEHQEEAEAGYERTAKLKSLRLAKEAADAAAKALMPPKKPRSQKRSAAKTEG